MGSEILIVDDETDICRLIQGILQDEGYATRAASSAEDAYKALEKELPDLLILDIWLQGSDEGGIDILEKVKQNHPYLPVLMISGHGTIETAVSAIKRGAYDFIEKPFKADRLLLMIERALETAQLRRENAFLKKKTEGGGELIGTSQAVQNLRAVLERVAPTNSRILLTGEAGTGKELAARTIHRLSPRRDRPFMILNCATLSPERLEAELFGSAGEAEKTGLLEKADGGTLFLDEVADMPPETQGKILRFLQEQRFQKTGSLEPVDVDVRIIASTNKDLEQAIEQGKFRSDLYYRLNVVRILLPALRDRLEDIPALTGHFVSLHAEISGLHKKPFSDQAFAVMQSYGWPGNIRQLRNVVEWVMIMHAGGQGEKINPENLPPEIGRGESDPGKSALSAASFLGLPLRQARENFEREYLMAQVGRFGGNISKTAQFVGMERSALHRKIKALEAGAAEKNQDNEPGGENRDIRRKRA